MVSTWSIRQIMFHPQPYHMRSAHLRLCVPLCSSMFRHVPLCASVRLGVTPCASVETSVRPRAPLRAAVTYTSSPFRPCTTLSCDTRTLVNRRDIWQADVATTPAQRSGVGDHIAQQLATSPLHWPPTEALRICSERARALLPRAASARSLRVGLGFSHAGLRSRRDRRSDRHCHTRGYQLGKTNELQPK